MSDDLVPIDKRSAYCAASSAARAEIAALKADIADDATDTTEERAIIKWLLRQSMLTGDPGLAGSLAALSDKLANSHRIASTALSLYVHKDVMKRFLKDEVLDIVFAAFKPVCSSDEQFATIVERIEETLAERWGALKNNAGERTMVHQRHVSEFQQGDA